MTVPKGILRGRYALGDPIASGGMATVHLGRVTAAGGFARIVAIKRLQADLIGSPEHESILRDEARLASRIRHPNVVAILDMLREGKEMFLVMEHVTGSSVAQLVFREGGQAVDPEVVGGVICGVLEGLHAAHVAKGDDGERLDIVHRDVSPENVLVGLDGMARLLDFGVAKGKGRAQVTRAGQLKGKFAYMPPEVVMGEDFSQRGDQYAVGVVMWEMLTGARLFEPEHGKPQVDLIPRVAESKIDAPSSREKGLSPELDAVVMKALSRDPSDRFESVRQFALAIESCLKLASPRRIGKWVAERAEAELAEKERQLDQFERWAEELQGASAADEMAHHTVEPRLSNDPNAATEGPGGSLTEALQAAGEAKLLRDQDRRQIILWRVIAFTLAVSLAYALLR